MRITNGEAIGIIDTVNEIQDKDVPVKTAYKLFDIVTKVNDTYMTYMKTLNKVMEKAGVNNPDDPAVNKEVMELLNMEVEVDVVPITRTELMESEINLNLAQLVRLNPVVENDG